MDKRSQKERLTIAETLLASVWKEYCNDQIEEGNEQIAVYIETYINRIQWKLNSLRNPRKEDVMDLIERQAAIDGIEQFRPIEPKRGETSMEAVNRSAWNCAINCVEMFIRTMPPSTRPEIIRCKDCIYYRQEIDMCDEPHSTAHNIVHEDDYCSRVKRGTDEQTN